MFGLYTEPEVELRFSSFDEEEFAFPSWVSIAPTPTDFLWYFKF